MLGVQDLRGGATYKEEGSPFVVVKYEHIKMGRGSATIKVRVRNLLSGAVVDKTYINSAKVEEINTHRKAMQYLYKDGEEYVFMDPKDFEQASISEKVVAENGVYLKEGITVNVLFWDDRPLWIELPPKMEFTIAQTDPGVKGNSVSNLYKSAKLDNGMTVKVPLFIGEGEKVIIDTRDGSYAERVKN